MTRYAFWFGNRAVVWLLALALPVVGLAGVVSELRGPAHVHADASAPHGASMPGHAHERVEHHHHAAGDGAIEVDDDDDDHYHEALAGERNKSSSSGAFDTLTPAFLPPVWNSRSGAIAAGDARKPPPPVPGRLERPPIPPAVRLFA